MRFGSNLSFLFSAFPFYRILLICKQFYFKLEQQSWRRLCFGCETWGIHRRTDADLAPDSWSGLILKPSLYYNLWDYLQRVIRGRRCDWELEYKRSVSTGHLHFQDQFNQTDPLRGPRPRWINSSLWAKSSKTGVVMPAQRSQSILILPEEALCFNYWRFIVADMF